MFEKTLEKNLEGGKNSKNCDMAVANAIHEQVNVLQKKHACTRYAYKVVNVYKSERKKKDSIDCVKLIQLLWLLLLLG